MTTETVTDYEVETKEIDREVTYCDSCGAKVDEDGEPAVPLVAASKKKPSSTDTSLGIDMARHAGRAHPFPEDIFEQALNGPIKSSGTFTGGIVMEDVCNDCLRELAGGEVKQGDVDGSSGVSYTDYEKAEKYAQKARGLKKRFSKGVVALLLISAAVNILNIIGLIPAMLGLLILSVAVTGFAILELLAQRLE